MKRPRRLLRVLLVAAALPAWLGCDTHPLDATLLGSRTLAEGLVAHYTFDEGAGAVVHDRSGNRRDGTLTGGLWILDGKFGGAVHLRGQPADGGAGDYMTVSPFPDASQSWSVSTWIRPANPLPDALETILSTEVVFEGGWQFNLEQDGGLACHFAYYENAGGKVYALVRVALVGGSWTHVTAVVDAAAGTLTVYLNAAVAGSIAVDRLILPGTVDLFMGTWSGGTTYPRFLAGDIDDVAVYARPLAAAEVAELDQHPPPDPQ